MIDSAPSRIPFGAKIDRKSVITIQIWFGLTIVRKNFTAWRTERSYWPHTRGNLFSIPFRLERIWSCWQFSFGLWTTKRNSVGFIIKRKTSTAIIFLPIRKESEIYFSEWRDFYLSISQKLGNIFLYAAIYIRYTQRNCFWIFLNQIKSHCIYHFQIDFEPYGMSLSSISFGIW